MDRQQLRKHIRQQRRALTPHQRHLLARQLAQKLSSNRLFQNARRIAVYLPNDGEMDLHPLIRIASQRGKKCYLPVISQMSHNRLWFAPYQSGQKLSPNIYGIPEPSNGKWQGHSPIGLDLILMPLVGFDEKGNRLGMGGGYYDRTLAYLNRRQHWHRPLLMGVAYEFQKLENLKAEAWDIPLHGVITESNIYLRK